MNTKELLYYNSFGGFTKDKNNYIVKTSEKVTPTPWSHIMANENFGTIVTASGGGYTWSKNSRDNKITTWSNDPVTDAPSELLYINDGEKNIYSTPYNSLENYEVEYGFGYAKYKYLGENIETTLLVYIPIDKNKKVLKYTIENLSDEEKDFDVYYYIEPVLGVSREYTKKFLSIETKNNGVIIKNFYREFYQNEAVKVLSNFDVSTSISDDKNITLKCNIKLGAKESKSIYFEISIEDEEILNFDTNSDLEKINNFWEDILGKIKVKTPVESMNIMMNGWLRLSNYCKQTLGQDIFLSGRWGLWL